MVHMCGVWPDGRKKIILNQKRETDFALPLKAQTADENQTVLIYTEKKFF